MRKKEFCLIPLVLLIFLQTARASNNGPGFFLQPDTTDMLPILKSQKSEGLQVRLGFHIGMNIPYNGEISFHFNLLP